MIKANNFIMKDEVIKRLLGQNEFDVSVTVGLSDLYEFADYLIGNAIVIAESRAKEKVKNTTYLTSREVMEKCRISEATLWRWTNSGYLKANKIGGTNRYLLADVENITNGKKI